ncbi:MAG: hypothetical protein EOP51_32070, partial [Sphingobacteriales bacterium]
MPVQWEWIDNKLVITIAYSKGCLLKQLSLNGKAKLAPEGVFTGFTTNAGSFSSAQLLSKIGITENTNAVTLNNIRYGSDQLQVTERWTFSIIRNRILWNISRTYNKNAQVEEVAFPSWNFASLNEW